ncbi:MAG: heavy metal translocating P-type ATPase [Verrucomicrobiota bacterium]
MAKVSSQSICRHCGTPYTPGAHLPEGYCCHGCAYVYQLIAEEGLERYYDLKDRAIQPVGSTPLQTQSFAWLREKQASLEEETEKGAALKATFHLQGMSCVGCVWLVEKLYLRHEGAIRAAADPQRGELRLQWVAGQLPLDEFAVELQRHGYLISPEQAGGRDLAHELLGRLALCGAFALNAMLFTLPRYLGMEDDFALAGLFSLLTLLFATLSFVVGGSYFIVRAARALRRRVLHIDLPIALGLSLAYAGSLAGWVMQEERFLYFDFVSIFAFLMLVGRWLQERAVVRNRNQLTAQQAEPEAVTRLTPLGSERVPLASVERGDEIEIGPGEMVPVSGELQTAEAMLSLEWINGESEPRSFPLGRHVPAGASSLERQPIRLRVTERWADSLLARLLAHEERPESARGYEVVLKWYLVAVLLVAIAGGMFWLLVPGDPLTAWQVVLSILVVSCPCAVGIAHPLADELAVGRLRMRGLFVKDLGLFARLGRIRDLLFDKTGTLTFEHPVLQNPAALQALAARDRAVLRQMVEESHHPLSRSLRETLLATERHDAGFARPDGAPEDLAISEVTGAGIRASAPDADANWTLGRADWDGTRATGTADRANDVVFRRDGEELAAFHFADQLREQAAATVAELRARFGVWILSGDRREKVDTMARQLDLPPEAALAGLSPEEKAEWVASRPAGSTLFLGDGANDSLAFDHAALRGTPVIHRGVLAQKADFYFLSRGLRCLVDLFAVGQQRNHAVHRVFAFAVTYNLVAIAICLAGAMNPLLAAILMPLSSLTTLGIVQAHFRG